MDKDKQGLSLEDDKLPDQVTPKSPTQPLPKNQTKSGTNVNIKG